MYYENRSFSVLLFKISSIYMYLLLRLLYASLTLLRFLVKSARVSNILLYDDGGGGGDIAYNVNGQFDA
jgi:hypothetical protein